MNQTYFLGANSKDGFISLYSSFPPGEGDLLHIIKGGPGTGKSGFMRRIGQAAEERGLDVHYVRCSGDPGSLDGLYIPELKLAWADGTSPHVLEPAVFGHDSDYVNLGQFCRCPLSPEDGQRAEELNRSYKAIYRQAYSLLSALNSLQEGCVPAVFGADEREKLQKRINAIFNKSFSRSKGGGGKVEKRFLSALSCLGLYRLPEEFSKLCKLVYSFDSHLGGDRLALELAAEEAERRGLDCLRCLSPLNCDAAEALIFPQAGLALTDGSWNVEGAKHIRADLVLPGELRREAASMQARAANASKASLNLALDRLRRAKELHDQLEAVYRPYMDFAALSVFTDKTISELF